MMTNVEQPAPYLTAYDGFLFHSSGCSCHARVHALEIFFPLHIMRLRLSLSL